MRAEDRTAQFIHVIKMELERAATLKDEFIEVYYTIQLPTHAITYMTTQTHTSMYSFLCHVSQEFSEEDFLAIVNGWREKLQRCNSGDQRWGLFHATKK